MFKSGWTFSVRHFSLRFFFDSIPVDLIYTRFYISAWTSYDANVQMTINTSAFNNLSRYELLLQGRSSWSTRYLSHTTQHLLARFGHIQWRKSDAVPPIWYTFSSFDIPALQKELNFYYRSLSGSFFVSSIPFCWNCFGCISWWQWRRTNDTERFGAWGCRD